MATGVPEAEVFAAADRVLARGERPTVERVRVELGRGSPSRIGQLLEQWWDVLAKRLAAETRLPDLPKGIAEAFLSVWTGAIAQAEQAIEARVAAERENLQQAHAALAEERTRSQAEIEVAHQEVEVAQQAASVAQTRLTDAQQLTDRLSHQLADVLQQRDAVQARADQLTEEVIALGNRLRKQDAAAAAERESQARHALAIEDRCHLEVDRARQETKDLRSQITAFERDMAARERQRDDARNTLTAAQREAAGHRARAEALEQQLARLSELHKTLQSSLAKPSGPPPGSKPRQKKKPVASKSKAKRARPRLPAAR
jgi:chromosome segregation ATPase